MDKETQDAFKTMGNLITKGFMATQQEFKAIRQDMAGMATKQDIKDIRQDMAGIDGRLDKVENRLDKIESDLHYIHNDTKTIPDLFNLIKEQAEEISTLKV